MLAAHVSSVLFVGVRMKYSVSSVQGSIWPAAPILPELRLEDVGQLDPEQDEYPDEEHGDQREHEEGQRTGDQVHARKHRDVFPEDGSQELEQNGDGRAGRSRSPRRPLQSQCRSRNEAKSPISMSVTCRSRNSARNSPKGNFR